MNHVVYAMLLSDLLLFPLSHPWMMNQLDLPYSRLQGHPSHHPTCCICHLPNVVWIKHTSKRKGSDSSVMMGKKFSEFQVEPVSGGTTESGQAFWESLKTSARKKVLLCYQICSAWPGPNLRMFHLWTHGPSVCLS